MKYFPDTIYIYKEAVIIPCMSMAYVLRMYLEKNKKLELCTRGEIYHVCQDK